MVAFGVGLLRAVAPVVLSQIGNGTGRNGVGQRILSGIRLMQILALARDDDSDFDRIGDLCLHAINELGPDVADKIIAGYAEANVPAAQNDKFTSAL